MEVVEQGVRICGTDELLVEDVCRVPWEGAVEGGLADDLDRGGSGGGFVVCCRGRVEDGKSSVEVRRGGGVVVVVISRHILVFVVHRSSRAFMKYLLIGRERSESRHAFWGRVTAK